jgi:hypothetical protein
VDDVIQALLDLRHVANANHGNHSQQQKQQGKTQSQPGSDFQYGETHIRSVG